MQFLRPGEFGGLTSLLSSHSHQVGGECECLSPCGGSQTPAALHAGGGGVVERGSERKKNFLKPLAHALSQLAGSLPTSSLVGPQRLGPQREHVARSRSLRAWAGACARAFWTREPGVIRGGARGGRTVGGGRRYGASVVTCSLVIAAATTPPALFPFWSGRSVPRAPGRD